MIFLSYRNKDNPLVYIRFCNSCTPILYFHIEFISQTTEIIHFLNLSLLHTYLIMALKLSNIELEQRAYIKFRSILKDTNRNIHTDLTDLTDVCGDEALSFTTVKRWAKLFREGRETTEDRPRAGRPLSAVCEESVSYVHEFLRDDPCCSIEEISRYTEVSTGSVYRILKEHLGVRKVCARWVPYSLSEAQEVKRVQCCQKLLSQFGKCDERRLFEIATIDETWIYYQQPYTKAKSMCWLSPDQPRPKNLEPTFVPRRCYTQ